MQGRRGSGMIVTAIFIEQQERYCRLPRAVVHELGLQDSNLKLLRLEWLRGGDSFVAVEDEEEEEEGEEAYAVWNGALSRIQVDSIELPLRHRVLAQARSPGASKCNAPISQEEEEEESKEERVLVKVSVEEGVPLAVSIELVPVSAYDWEIVSTHCDMAESILLQQVGAVIKGEKITIKLTARLSASFIVGQMQVALDAASSRRRHAKEMAILSIDTVVSIAPFPCASSTPAVLVPQQQQQKAQVTEKDISDASSFQVLRVLPLAFRRHDTSFKCSSSSISSSSSSNSSKSSIGSSGNLPKRQFAPNNGSTLSEEEQQRALERLLESYSATGIDVDIDEDDEQGVHKPRVSLLQGVDEATCLVHPLFFQSIAEHIANEGDDEKANAAMEFFSSGRLRDCRRSYLAVLALKQSAKEREEGDSSGSSTVRPLSSTVLVKVVCSSSVRPNHISLSLTMRLAMCLLDYQAVTLRLLDTTRTEDLPIRPLKLSLLPVRWHRAASNKEQDAPSSSSLSSTSPISLSNLSEKAEQLEEVRAALFRLFSQCDGMPFLMSDGAVVTLTHLRKNLALSPSSISSAWKDAGKGTSIKIDYLVYLREPPMPPTVDEQSNPISLSSSSSQPSTVSPSMASPKYTIVYENKDDDLLDCLEVLDVFPAISAALPAQIYNQLLEPTSSSSASNVIKLFGFEAVQRSILLDAMTLLLPVAVLQRVSGHIPPISGLLIEGAKGQGKTVLAREVAKIASSCPRMNVHEEYVACNLLVGKPMSFILLSLKHAFGQARLKAPSILILDNIDDLCPMFDESFGNVAAEQVGLISLQLERLLSEIADQNKYSHDNARVLFTQKLQQQQQQQQRRRRQETYEDVYLEDRVVASALQGAVYVLGTCTSTSKVSARLQASYGLRRSVALPSLAASARIGLLDHSLSSFGFPLQKYSCNDKHSPSYSAREFEQLSALTEGMFALDLIQLAKKTCLFSARRVAALIASTSTSSDQMHSTFEDVIESAKGFTCIAASSSSSSASSASALVPPPRATWSDIGGHDSLKTSLRSLFRSPVLFRALFQNSPVRAPRAAMLFGPPGCGKTLLAQAAGTECGLTCIFIRGPQLLDKYIGASEKAVRDLFDRARSTGRPTLLFFDEFEALAPKRGRDNTGVSDRVVNQLLTFLDGVEATMGGGGGAKDTQDNGQVFVLAATSRPDLIDVALLRPGRIEEHLYVGLPNESERAEILVLALAKQLGEVSEDLTETVRFVSTHERCELFTPADLRAVVNTAYLLAVHELMGKEQVQTDRAIEDVDLWGEEEEEGVEAASSRGGGGGSGVGVGASFKDVDFPRGPKKQEAPPVALSLLPRHLLKAFEKTRPSLSLKDVAFYSECHQRFRKPSSSASSSTHPSLATPSSVSSTLYQGGGEAQDNASSVFYVAPSGASFGIGMEQRTMLA